MISTMWKDRRCGMKERREDKQKKFVFKYRSSTWTSDAIHFQFNMQKRINFVACSMQSAVRTLHTVDHATMHKYYIWFLTELSTNEIYFFGWFAGILFFYYLIWTKEIENGKIFLSFQSHNRNSSFHRTQTSPIRRQLGYLY